jgi:hypothetical protein
MRRRIGEGDGDLHGLPPGWFCSSATAALDLDGSSELAFGAHVDDADGASTHNGRCR